MTPVTDWSTFVGVLISIPILILVGMFVAFCVGLVQAAGRETPKPGDDE